jgi:RimJ/RimL family protein N-acetyltransferase
MNYLQNYSTERLFIRPLEKSDCYLWDSYFENNENLKFLNLNNDLTNAEKSVQWIDNQIRRYNNNLYGTTGFVSKRYECLNWSMWPAYPRT